MSEASNNWKPAVTTTVLVIYLALVQITEITYALNELSPPAAFESLQPYAFFGLVCWWLERDSVRNDFSWPLDMGMFLYAAWFFVLPYYLIKTRGLRGLADVLIFLAIVATVWIGSSLVIITLIDTGY